MANVQLENGYTKIANEILEALAKMPLNGTQRRIIDVIIRFTYGFKRKEHYFSINFLINAMSLKRTQYKQICRELKSLIDMNILIEQSEPTKNNSRRLSFNKNFDLWTNKTTGLNRPEDKKDQSEWTNKTREPLDELDHQEIKEKKTINKSVCDEFFESIWKLYPKRNGKGKVKKAQKEKLFKIGYDELSRAIERYKKDKAGIDQQYIMYGSTFFNSGYIDYLDSEAEPPKQLGEVVQSDFTADELAFIEKMKR